LRHTESTSCHFSRHCFSLTLCSEVTFKKERILSFKK
jgi:hypothetical protein